VWPREAEAQQDDTWSKEPESIAKEKEKEKDIRRTFKILRKVWLDIGIEKVDMHESITVKVLLDSGTMEMFINRKIVKKHSFKMTKLKRPLKVKNMDGTENSEENIMHQVKVNIFYKNHVERMRMNRRFAHFPLTDLVPTVKDFVKFLKKHPSVKDFVKFLKEHPSAFAFPSQDRPSFEPPEPP